MLINKMCILSFNKHKFNTDLIKSNVYSLCGFRGGSVVKNPPANAGDARDAGWLPGLERSPAEGNDYPLQYSCLENPID